MDTIEFSFLKYEGDKAHVFNVLKKLNERFLLKLDITYLAEITCSYSNAVLLPKVVVKLTEYGETDEDLTSVNFAVPPPTYTKLLECMRYMAFTVVNNAISHKLGKAYKNPNGLTNIIGQIVSQCEFRLIASVVLTENIVAFLKESSANPKS